MRGLGPPAGRPAGPGNRPLSFGEFRRRYPGFLLAMVGIIVALLALDGWLVHRRALYRAEIQRLRAGMDDFERQRSDAILSSRERHWRMMTQLIRLQARWGKDIHLAVSVDSSRMYLEREGALLREIQVSVGPERRIGKVPDTVQMAIPRGTRTVLAVLGPTDGWEVPEWVYRDRGIPAPPTAAGRTIPGALGPTAIVLDGGTVIYSLPDAGPLADSAYTMPGSIRASAQDLEAIVQNVTKGMVVYFY